MTLKEPILLYESKKLYYISKGDVFIVMEPVTINNHDFKKYQTLTVKQIFSDVIGVTIHMIDRYDKLHIISELYLHYMKKEVI